MEVNAIFIDDYESLLIGQMKDFAKILDRARQKALNEQRTIVLNCSEDGVLESVTIGQDRIFFMLKNIRIDDPENYKSVLTMVDDYVNTINEHENDGELERKNVLFLDLCLDGSRSAPSKEYLISMSELCDSMVVITSWPNFYENNISDDGRYYRGLSKKVFFIKRALDKQGRDLNWIATDNNGFYFTKEIEKIKNEDLKWLINEFKGADSICLKYLASIFLAVGLMIK